MNIKVAAFTESEKSSNTVAFSDNLYTCFYKNTQSKNGDRSFEILAFVFDLICYLIVCFKDFKDDLCWN